jgi:multiple sugar transport system permease protein
VLGAWMFDQYNGFFNNLLAVFGVDGPAWQSSGGWAMFSVILMTLWQRIGFDMLIYLAGLQGVGQDVLEAAAIDGATGWQKFRRVTFPLLGPSTFFLLIMNLIYSFQIFDTVFAMTAGGPDYSTTMLVTYAYRTGFDEHGSGQLGYAATIGVVIYLITLAITIVQWRANKTRDQVS